MKSNIVLSYIAMLSVVGFFLWVIRNFVRSMRQNSQPAPALSALGESTDTEKRSVDWPVHIFLDQEDDIPLPGRLASISPAYAFVESSACLKTGQKVTLYVDAPGQEQVSLTARVIWAREGRDGRNAAQLSFDDLSLGKRNQLFQLAPGA